MKSVKNPTEKQTVEFLKQRTTLLKQLHIFRKLQSTYMPNLRQYLTATQRQLWDTEASVNVEAVCLFMPSDILDKTKCGKACALGLPEMEAELRVGEAREALEALRQGLQTRTVTNRFRLRHCRRMLTRGQGILRQINLRIHKAKLRYRFARNALVQLQGHRPWEKE
jgi:hypothetical protein